MPLLPIGGGGDEAVQFRIEVDDKGTPVFQRFQRTVQDTLQSVNRASMGMYGPTGTAVETMGKKVEASGKAMAVSRQEVQHLQHAFGILGFHLQSAGAQAARATSAFAGLAMHGFSPLSLAIAGLAAGIGVVIMRHQEATAEAEKHAAAEKALFEAARKNQMGVAGIGDTGAALKETRRDANWARGLLEETERTMAAEIWKKHTTLPFGQAGPAGTWAAKFADDREGILKQAPDAEQKMLEDLRARVERLTLAETSMSGAKERTAGTARGHATGPDQALTEADKEALFRHERDRKAALEGMARFDKEIDSTNEALQTAALDEHERARRQSIQEMADFDKKIDEVNKAAYEAELFNHEQGRKASIEAMLEFDRQLVEAVQEESRRAGIVSNYEGSQADRHALAMAPTDDARRLLELQLEFAETMRNLGPNASPDETDRARAAYGQRVTQLGGEDSMAMGSKYGKGVASSLVGSFAQELTNAAMGAKVDLQRLAQSFMQTLTSAFFSALMEATIQKPLERGFSALFQAGIGVLQGGATNTTPGGGAGVGGGPEFAPSGTRSPDLRLTVETYPVVYPDEVSGKTSRRASQSLVVKGSSRSGVRGYRAPA